MVHAEARKIEPATLLNKRLHPSMYNLGQQVDEANRHAIVGCALLAGRDQPALLVGQTDMGGLKSRIAAAIGFLETLRRAEIDASSEREVTFRFRSGAQRRFNGRSLLLSFSIPQFFFHVTTAYDILRHAGVDLAKRDFLGMPKPA